LLRRRDCISSAPVGFTFYQNANEDFIRLVMVENIHNGVHLAKWEAIQDLNVSVITAIGKIYRRGPRAASSDRASTKLTST
jgi:Tetracyclin repressor-like, C-terminal domain